MIDERIRRVTRPTPNVASAGAVRVTLDEARAGLLSQRTGSPDWKVTVHQLVAEGDPVASELTITGTHSGQFKRHAPTGKPVSFNGHHMDRASDGKIVETWHRPDFLTLLIQIGAVPEDVMSG
ncbi:MAG: ester cyclase [Dehalococcoidia bacterium]|jgi:predicted ester cyclase|nr:ester cyclase [Dehalococcoidia bacterium]